MSNYGLKIGMSTKEVYNLAKKSKTSQEIKKLIFNFCNQDLDKKITNDIELHILNTWFSGQKKIKMPNIKDSSFLSQCVHALASLVGVDEHDKLGDHGDGCVSITTWEYGIGGQFNAKDWTNSCLYDQNKDGYADLYISNLWHNTTSKGSTSMRF